MDSFDPPAATVCFSCDKVFFDEEALDLALGETALDTSLPIVTQRRLASRVLVAASLATALESEEDYRSALADAGEELTDPEEIAFMGAFALGLLDDLRLELGEQTHQVDLLIRRLEEFAGDAAR